MKKLFLYFLVLGALACQKEESARVRNPTSTLALDPVTEALPVNQLQYIGTHNSYRKMTDPDIFNFLKALTGFLPDDLDVLGWDYKHLPIPDQLTYGIRSLELDIYHDPEGMRYFYRLGNRLVGKPVASYIDELKPPGMKLLHVPDVDYNTHNYTFKSAMRTVKNWSDQHPQHLPIFILVELKTTAVGNVLPSGFVKALPFSAGALDSVDQEIIDVFGAGSSQVFRPDDLRGSYATLKEAVQNKNWPSVSAMRGKIVFIVYRNENYTVGHPNLEGRQMFQFSQESSPNAAFILLDGAQGSFSEIQRLVQAGYMIRSRSDGSPNVAKTGDYSGRDAAFSSGAQIISTDYYIPDSRAGQPGWSDYRVKFDDISYARVNVVNGPDSLSGKHVRE